MRETYKARIQALERVTNAHKWHIQNLIEMENAHRKRIEALEKALEDA